MDVILIAAALATTLNANAKGFRDCRVSEGSTGLCHSFDTVKERGNIPGKTRQGAQGKTDGHFRIWRGRLRTAGVVPSFS